jgi:hypothetical protein
MDGEQQTGQQETQQDADYSYGDPGDGQDYIDRSKIDFDPKDGLYSGTAVDGTSEIPGPHLRDGDNEREPEELRKEAEEQANRDGVDPSDTPAAKSPVARAAEKSNQEREG